MKTHHALHLCGEAGPIGDQPTCEACQIVDEVVRSGETMNEVADAHAMPVSLVRDVLISCGRRRDS